MWGIAGRRRRSPDRGAVAVEFAFILIPFLILIFGMVQFSVYFFSGQSGASASREAARRAAVGDQDCTAMRTAVSGAVKLNSGTVTTKRSYYAVGDTTFNTPLTTPALGNNVRVTITYNVLNFNFPFIPVPNGGAINEKSYARVENATASSVPCS
jgi:Flp pilus assembly protein TadG